MGLLQCVVHWTAFEEHPEATAGEECRTRDSYEYIAVYRYFCALRTTLIESVLLGATQGAGCHLQYKTFCGTGEDYLLDCFFLVIMHDAGPLH